MTRRRVLQIVASSLLFTAAIADEPDANSIMRNNLFATKLTAAQSTTQLELINDRGKIRRRIMTLTAKLQPNGIDSNLLIIFRTPADIAGTTFLQLQHIDADDDLWIYLPALKKSRRLVANNKKDSFFGTDFAYGDILLPRVELYRHMLRGSEVVDGHDCHVIESIPIDEEVQRESGYSRKISRIRKDNHVEVRVEYFDTSGKLLKTQEITDHKLLEPENQRWIALKRTMADHQSGHETIFTVTDVKVGIPVADNLFTTRTIESQ